jgi:hypothetical protein
VDIGCSTAVPMLRPWSLVIQPSFLQDQDI